MNTIKSLLFFVSIFIAIASCNIQNQTECAFINRLQPTTLTNGFQMDGYWVWGMSVIKVDDGLYHGYASRWPDSIPFAPNWVTNSEIVHATSKTPEGPYEFQSVVFKRRGKEFWDGEMTHNPTIHKSGDTYLLFYIGTTYIFDFPAGAVSHDSSRIARANQRIGMATAKSPWGPWKRPDQPVLKPRSGKWDALITVNPSVCIKPDGSILLVYKSTSHQQGLLKLGVAGAANYDQPFLRLVDDPIFQFDEEEGEMGDQKSKHVEDPYIWWNGKNFELIMKDMNGNICGIKGGGIHAVSQDGIEWKISDPPLAYSKDILLNNGDTLKAPALERPQLLVENGTPTHLYMAVGLRDEKAEGYHHLNKSWNICIPLQTK